MFLHSRSHDCVHLCTTLGRVGESCAEQCTLFCTIVHKHAACGAGYRTVVLAIHAPRRDIKPGGEAGYQP